MIDLLNIMFNGFSRALDIMLSLEIPLGSVLGSITIRGIYVFIFLVMMGFKFYKVITKDSVDVGGKK